VPIRLPSPETAYLKRVVGALQRCLGQRLVGIYLFGSAAYSAYEPGISDLDVQAVVTESLSKRNRKQIAGLLTHQVLTCPARRLEFVCYARTSVYPASRYPQFELNFNTGAGEEDHISLDPAEESSHWFLLDIAMGRALGRPLLGPEPAQVFAPIPRIWQLEAIAESLVWHSEHEPTSANTVLNACRGWRYVATGHFGSKRDGCAWARQQPACPVGVLEADRLRQLGSHLSVSSATELVKIVTEAVHEAIRLELGSA